MGVILEMTVQDTVMDVVPFVMTDMDTSPVGVNIVKFTFIQIYNV